MRVATAAEIRALDAGAIEAGISSILLMETAGRGAADLLLDRARPRRVVVLCGKGKNGGDGLVVARRLHVAGVGAAVLLVGRAAELSGDPATNLAAARAAGIEVLEAPDEAAVAAAAPRLAAADALVDALLGTGSRGAPEGAVAAAVAAAAAAGRPILAVDLPTGVDADTGAVRGAAVRAAWTATMGAAKRGLLLHPGAAHAGEVVLVPLPYPPQALEALPGRRPEPAEIAAFWPRRAATAHKGSAKVLVIGGSEGMTGAPLLTARAAARAGAGLVHLAVPAGVAGDVAQVVEAVKVPLGASPVLDDAGAEEAVARAADAHAVVVGPGLGRGRAVLDLLRFVISRCPKPMAVDADALVAVAGAPACLAGRSAPTVLTPHPGEFALLAGTTVAEVEADRVEAARRLSARLRAVVVLKGAPTVVAAPDGRYWINGTGSQVLASGGTGDVLAGIVGALLAQGLGAAEAGVAAAHIHGLAADLWRAETAARAGVSPASVVSGLVAGDLCDILPRAAAAVRGAETVDSVSSP